MPNPQSIYGDIRQAHRHDSGHKHVDGTAEYVDDIPEPAGLLHLYIAMSPHANADILGMDLSQVKSASGVECVLTHEDVPGSNDVSPHSHDEEMFATTAVHYAGQSLFAVLADTIGNARAAAKLAKINYRVKTPIVTIADARKAESFLASSQKMVLGDSKKALKQSKHRLSSRVHIGGQDHFYLEGQIALAIPKEDQDVHVFSSTQNPSEVQRVVARVLGVPSNCVTIEVRRMGGGFGGKETSPNLMASCAALGSKITKRAVKCRLDRDDDMIMTGKRHDFEVDYDVGFDDNGRVTGIELELASRCGFSQDLSLPVNDRAMFHSDNCYALNDITIVSHRYRTNTVSNTAFRGFGGPQGMLAIECVMEAIANYLNLDPVTVRQRNFYSKERGLTTPYHQTIEDFVADEIVEELIRLSDYECRRDAIRAFNEKNPYFKKGISLTPVKFGISFTLKHLNQAGALIHIYNDGSIHLNHGGTEMGQGLFTKVAQIVAHEFQVDIDRIKITATSTGKVPNTSPTAASSGSDLNGMAALNAAKTIKARLIGFICDEYGVSPDAVVFSNNQIIIGQTSLSFDELIEKAYVGRISLSSTGYYKTPHIHFDKASNTGRPFYYYAYGAAVSEVVIDVLTGENRVLRADILHEAGKSLNPALDKGQIEGGFIQGMGWLTTEELFFDTNGVLKTHAPSTYKIPVCSDRPDTLNLHLWKRGENVMETIHKSKAVGEPPFMLANSVFLALSDAIRSIGKSGTLVNLEAPATAENILKAISLVSSDEI